MLPCSPLTSVMAAHADPLCDTRMTQSQLQVGRIAFVGTGRNEPLTTITLPLAETSRANDGTQRTQDNKRYD